MSCSKECVTNWSSVSFSASGLHFFYQFGVAKKLLDTGVRIKRVYCSSAGAPIGLYYLLDLRDDISLEDLLQCLPTGKDRKAPLCHAFQRDSSKNAKGIELAHQRFMRVVWKILQKYPNAYQDLSGRLFISVTTWPWFASQTICHWKSNEDLYRCILATTCIPGVDTKFEPVCYYKNWFVDGGFVNTHPVEDSRTVCVSTQPITQWWSKAYHVKDCKWPEISRSLKGKGSLKVKKYEFYRGLSFLGEKDADQYLEYRSQHCHC